MEWILEFRWQTLLRHWKVKTRRFRIIFYSTCCCWYYAQLGFEKSQRKAGEVLGSFQDLRNKNCRRGAAKVLQLLVQSKTWQEQASSQFQKFNIFFIQSLPTRDLTKQPENSKEREFSLESKTEWQNGGCKRNENKRLQRNG